MEASMVIIYMISINTDSIYPGVPGIYLVDLLCNRFGFDNPTSLQWHETLQLCNKIHDSQLGKKEVNLIQG